MNKKIEKYILENLPKTIRFNPEDSESFIGLPYTYTVPCVSDMFQEMYYWDTYFTNLGLIALNNITVAKNNVDNLLYLVEKYGFVPNANRKHFLIQSQPPFLSQMVREVFDITHDKQWLLSAYCILEMEYNFWQEKRILKNGLNAYAGHYVDQNRFEGSVKYGLSRIGYKPKELTDDIKMIVYKAIRSFCESGWDCTSRFLEKPYEFNAIDLNALLYGMENNMHYFCSVLQNGEESKWNKRIEQRKTKMQALWNEKEGVFKDFNPSTNEFSNYLSVASIYPLFVELATQKQAEITLEKLNLLELEYGISAGEPNPAWNCQWDYPNIWAPLQFITYRGLLNYGYTDIAKRIATKFIKLIEYNFSKTENLWEKYSGLTGETVSTDYVAPKMLGWTAGVYIYFCKELNM